MKVNQLKKLVATEAERDYHLFLKELIGEFPSFDGMSHWLFREFRQGRILLEEGRMIKLHEGRRYSLRLGDWERWWTSQDKSRVGFNIFQSQVNDVDKLVYDYARGLRRLQRRQGAVIYQFSDGWTIQQLASRQLAWEGDKMGHCVGQEGMGYGGHVKDRTLIIYSLRDASGRPHVTFDMAPVTMVNEDGQQRTNKAVSKFTKGLDPQQWQPTIAGARINQMQARSGAAPTAAHQARIREWMETLGVSTPHSAQAQPLKSLRSLKRAHREDGWSIPRDEYGCVTWTQTEWPTLLSKAFTDKDVDGSLDALYGWAEELNDVNQLRRRVNQLQRQWRYQLGPHRDWYDSEYPERIAYVCHRWDIQVEDIVASEQACVRRALNSRRPDDNAWRWRWVGGHSRAKAPRRRDVLHRMTTMREQYLEYQESDGHVIGQTGDEDLGASTTAASPAPVINDRR